jgi:hypothetical protein
MDILDEDLEEPSDEVPLVENQAPSGQSKFHATELQLFRDLDVFPIEQGCLQFKNYCRFIDTCEEGTCLSREMGSFSRPEFVPYLLYFSMGNHTNVFSETSPIFHSFNPPQKEVIERMVDLIQLWFIQDTELVQNVSRSIFHIRF